MGISLAEIRSKGWEVLVKELGYSGATKFILLYEPGKGNYIEERKELFKGVSIEDMEAEIRRTREARRS